MRNLLILFTLFIFNLSYLRAEDLGTKIANDYIKNQEPKKYDDDYLLTETSLTLSSNAWVNQWGDLSRYEETLQTLKPVTIETLLNSLATKEVLTSTDSRINLMPNNSANGIIWGMPEETLVEFLGTPMKISINFSGYYVLSVPDLLSEYDITINSPKGPIKVEHLVLETSPFFEGELKKTMLDHGGKTIVENNKSINYPNYWKFWERLVSRNWGNSPQRKVKIKGFVIWGSKQLSDHQNVIKELKLSVKIIRVEVLPE